MRRVKDPHKPVNTFADRRERGCSRPGALAAACLAAVSLCTAVAQDRTGQLRVDLTDNRGVDVPCRVELREDPWTVAHALEAPSGRTVASVPAGRYEAFVYAYDMGVPLLAAIQEVTVPEGDTAFLPIVLPEDTSVQHGLRAYDTDGDLVLNRVELEAGTDPADPTSIPGARQTPFSTRVLKEESGWYKGELHARSRHGTGQEEVSALVRRAERAGLDFLAIADRNTMAACRDEGFRSDRLVLIPAMEWGNDEYGYALILAPATKPRLARTRPEGMAIADLVMRQGGFFAAARTCFPGSPWQWGIGPVNGVQVWSRDWASVPPISLDDLDEVSARREEGHLLHSIARAAATPGLSANGQAEVFWNLEMARGLRACPIGGSLSGAPNVPLGRPTTWVYAAEKSLPGIMDGLRRGRTFVSENPDGPFLDFRIELGDGTVFLPGDIVPADRDLTLVARVGDAKGYKLQFVRDGYPVVTGNIEGDAQVHQYEEKPERYAVYRVRVVSSDPDAPIGPVRVHALSAPIFAVAPPRGMRVAPVDPDRTRR